MCENGLDVCSLPDIACGLYTIVLSQHHTHQQAGPDRAALSTQLLTAHTGNLRQSGEVHVRFFVARVGGSMPDHPWHRASPCSIGQPPGRRAWDHAPRHPSRPPGAPPPPGLWRSAVQRDVCWRWTGVAGWGRGALQGCPGGTASGRRRGKAGGGAMAHGMAHAQTGETPLRCTHVAPEATRDGVG